MASKIGGGKIFKGGGNYVAQIERPEYDIEDQVNLGGQVSQLRRDGYDRRVVGKARQYGVATNESIGMLNKAKHEHIAMIDDMNRQIGNPESGAYKGFTQNSLNQAIAYAMGKKKKSAKKHWANAKAYADSLSEQAKVKQDEMQKKFDAAGGQVGQAANLQSIIAHLAKRQKSDAATKASNSEVSGSGNIIAQLSPPPMESVGIESMLDQSRGLLN